MAKEDTLLNVAQVRERLGNCSRSHVYRLVKSQELKGIITGQVRGLRIYQSSLDKFIKKRDSARLAA